MDSTGYGSKKSGGRKEKLSSREKRRIVKVASNSMKSLNQIQSECQLNVSRSTVYWVLTDRPNIQKQNLISAPKILRRHIIARLNFAQENMQTDWEKVRDNWTSERLNVQKWFKS